MEKDEIIYENKDNSDIKNKINKNIANLNYFLEKSLININNINEIIEILNESKNILLSSEILKIDNIILEKIDELIQYLNNFNNIIDETFFNNIDIIKFYLNHNYSTWIIDQIDNNVKYIIDWKIIWYKEITQNIEFFLESDSKNLNKELFEKLTISIKIINKYFEENDFLDKEEKESFNLLNNYLNNPNIRDFDNIIIIFKKIKDNLIQKQNNTINNITEDIADETLEKLNLDLPKIFDNLYNYFSKLFNRKRENIEKNEIITLKKIMSKINIYLEENIESFSEIIKIQYDNLFNHIIELDTENIKEFKSEEIKIYFEDFIIILKEINSLKSKKKSKN